MFFIMKKGIYKEKLLIVTWLTKHNNNNGNNSNNSNNNETESDIDNDE